MLFDESLSSSSSYKPFYDAQWLHNRRKEETFDNKENLGLMSNRVEIVQSLISKNKSLEKELNLIKSSKLNSKFL